MTLNKSTINDWVKKETVDQIMSLYSGNGYRPYHNASHAMTVRYNAVMILEEKMSSKEIAELELAALIHDAIYVLGNKDNELRSSALAYAFTPSGLDADTVAQLVMATVPFSTTKDSSPRERAISDADLAGLGSESWNEYNFNSENINMEMKNFSENRNVLRIDFLQYVASLETPIFKTEYGLKNWEKRAHENILKDIKRIKETENR